MLDGFVVPVPKANLDRYKEMATLAGEVWKEHGALDYVECVADDVPYGELTSFPRAVQVKDDEMVVFSWITYEFARGPRRRQRQGDGRPAAEDGPERHAVRRQADDLRRLQADRGDVSGS